MRIELTLVNGRWIVDIRLPRHFRTPYRMRLLDCFESLALDTVLTFVGNDAPLLTLDHRDYLEELYAPFNEMGLQYVFREMVR